MKFSEYVGYLVRAESISARNELTELLAELIQELDIEKKITPSGQGSEVSELAAAMYMLFGKVTPHYDALEFDFSGKSMFNSLKSLISKSENILIDEIDRQYKDLGDIGDFVSWVFGKYSEKLVWKKNPESIDMFNFESASLRNDLTEILEDDVLSVYRWLLQLAKLEGKGSALLKREVFGEGLIRLAKAEGRQRQKYNFDMLKYLARIVSGKLRLGVNVKTVLDGISWAVVGDKSARKVLNRAYGVRSDIGLIAELALNDFESLEGLELSVGIPLAAQLVEREKDATSVFKRFDRVIVQPKYDGLRAQLHFDQKKSKVSIFSRNQEDITHMFPELIDFFENNCSLKESIVMDGEIIGVDESTGQFLPFQDTIQRKRKHGVEEAQADVPINYFVFDLLYLGGDLTQFELSKRLEKLNGLDLAHESKGLLQYTDSPVVSSAEELTEMFLSLVDKGLEGVICKIESAKYLPGERKYDWIKLKPNTYAELQDSVDCVVLGYYKGRGRRAKYGIGGFLVGIYNEELGVYQSLAKVGSGVKDEEWEVYREGLEGISVPEIPHNVQISKELLPDVFVSPEIVVEIDADEISISQSHMAGMGELSKVLPSEKLENLSKNIDIENVGFSLRFPRLKLWGRAKAPIDTTSVKELAGMY